MPVPTVMGDLSVTESSNSPSGSDPISTSLDNYLRAIQSILRSTNHKGPDIASGSSVAIGASPGEFLTVTGTTTITSFDSASAGINRVVHFSGALTLTHSTNIQLPGSVNYTTTAGDVLVFRSLGSGQWICVGLLGTSVQNFPNGVSIGGGSTVKKILRFSNSNVAGAAISAGDVRQITQTVSGATAGLQPVVISPTGMVGTNTEKLIVSAYVSATNQVTIKIHNPTSSTITASEFGWAGAVFVY